MRDYSLELVRRRLLHLGLLGAFLFSILLRTALTLNRKIDIDEFEHLHGAWMVSRHYVMYRDFWENHTPLFYYLMLPLFRLCREGPGLVLTARVIVSLTAFGILFLTYVVSRIYHDKLTSVLAVLILSYMVIFVEKSIEVRPDQFMVILWLASLWITIRAFSTGHRLGFLGAGFLMGIAFLFSPKAFLPCAALSLTFLIQSYIRNSRRVFLRFLTIQGTFTLGFLIPVAACVAIFYHTGTLKEMITLTILENFKYPNIYRPLYLLNLRNICFLLLALAGLIIHARRLRKSSSTERANQLVLLIPTVFLFLIFVFVQTAPYPQSVLLFAPLLAIYGAEAFRKALDGLPAPRLTRQANGKALRLRAARLLSFIVVLGAAFVIPCAMILFKLRPFSSTNAEQFQRMQYILNHTGPKDVVFDGESAYVFRPQAYFYGSLFQAILWRIQRGEITQDIPQSLVNTDCRWMIYDERVATLPQPVQAFLSENYTPSDFPGVYRAKRPTSK